jgi:hypothetical protein
MPEQYGKVMRAAIAANQAAFDNLKKIAVEVQAGITNLPIPKEVQDDLKRRIDEIVAAV